MDFVSPKTVKAEAEASPSPAAQGLGPKKAGGKVEKGAGRFAESLEKANASSKAQSLGEVARKQGSKGGIKASSESSKGLKELVDGLNGRELIQVLMKISPKQLAHTADSLGLDSKTLFPRGEAPDSTASSRKAGQNRGRLVDSLRRMVEQVGAQAVLAALAAATKSKPAAAPRGADPLRLEKNQTVGEAARSAGRKPRVVVVDLRKDQPALKATQQQPGPEKSSLASGVSRVMEAQDRESSVLFRPQFQDRAPAVSAEANLRSARPSPNFEQRFIPEVVKQTGIILKDGGAGEIRLVLKPENLGSLRIRLSLTESSLEGRIVVDNNSVKELVESSLDNLKSALRSEGYQTNLEVSVGHRRSSDGDGNNGSRHWWSGASEEFEKAIPLYLDMRPDYELVNVFA